MSGTRADRFLMLLWHAFYSDEIGINHEAGPDLEAFSADLETLGDHGWTIWPLDQALAALTAGNLPPKIVVLTADDGPIMDFEDFDHPQCGWQKSLDRRLREFVAARGADPGHRPHVSSFVIASPEARAEMDSKLCGGMDVLSDRWWAAAAASGRMGIENHSWDHNHPCLSRTCQRDGLGGDFALIDTEDECRLEIDRASDYIECVAARRPRYFAYPFGQASDYLRRHYLPTHAARLGIEAGIGCDPEPVTRNSDRWFLPRYICGRDWRSRTDLERILSEAG